MAVKDDKGRWIDAAGNHIPVKYVDPVDKKRDAMVEKVFRHALQAQERLRKFKELADHDIAKYLDWLAIRKEEDELNPGGNYKLKTFYGDKQIEIKINKIIEFDERIQLAKQKIDRCLERWSIGANSNLQVVVINAFKIDKKGNLNRDNILGLRTWSVKDDEWKAAMELINEAITITGTRKYLMFQIRDTPEAEWRTIRLDLAGV